MAEPDYTVGLDWLTRQFIADGEKGIDGNRRTPEEARRDYIRSALDLWFACREVFGYEPDYATTNFVSYLLFESAREAGISSDEADRLCVGVRDYLFGPNPPRSIRFNPLPPELEALVRGRRLSGGEKRLDDELRARWEALGP